MIVLCCSQACTCAECSLRVTHAALLKAYFPFHFFSRLSRLRLCYLVLMWDGVGTGGLPKIQAFHAVTDIVHLLSPTLWASQLVSPDAVSVEGESRWFEFLSIFEPKTWHFCGKAWGFGRAIWKFAGQEHKICEKRPGTSWNQQRNAWNSHLFGMPETLQTSMNPQRKLETFGKPRSTIE